MNYKIILIILLILFLLGNYFRESFTDKDTPTHYLLNSSKQPATFQLTNIISRSASGDKEDDFKNLYTPFGKEHFDQNADYEQGQLPILVLESYKECPTLHTLYKSLKKFKTGGYEQNENVEGYRFRSLIQSVFYNITEPIEVDYKLFDMFVEDKEDNITICPSPSPSPAECPAECPAESYQPNLKLYLEDSSNIKYKSSFTGNNLNYFDSVQPQYAFNHKEATFGVQENFERIDILRFMDFAFTTLCWGALHINLLKPLDNHFYAFPCQNKKCNTTYNKPHFFYLLPVKVRQICYEEGSEYTRAKCNGCASNIIVFFNQVPNKFKNLSNINSDIKIPSLITPS